MPGLSQALPPPPAVHEGMFPRHAAYPRAWDLPPPVKLFVVRVFFLLFMMQFWYNPPPLVSFPRKPLGPSPPHVTFLSFSPGHVPPVPPRNVTGPKKSHRLAFPGCDFQHTQHFIPCLERGRLIPVFRSFKFQVTQHTEPTPSSPPQSISPWAPASAFVCGVLLPLCKPAELAHPPPAFPTLLIDRFPRPSECATPGCGGLPTSQPLPFLPRPGPTRVTRWRFSRQRFCIVLSCFYPQKQFPWPGQGGFEVLVLVLSF